MNYYEIGKRIKATARPGLKLGEYNRLCNDVDQILCGIRKGIERRPPARVEAYEEAPDFIETQGEAVLRRLLAGERLDAMKGLNSPDIRSMQLRTIVCVLGKQGVNISREWVRLPSGKRAKQYWMTAEQVEEYNQLNSKN